MDPLYLYSSVLTVLVLAVILVRLLRWWFSRNTLAEATIRWAWEQAHVVVDDADETADVAKSTPSRILRIAVDYIRSEFGLMADTKANRLVVSDVVRKFLKTRGLRPSHISRQFPLIVEAYFLNSLDDLLLIEMRNTAFVRQHKRGGEVA